MFPPLNSTVPLPDEEDVAGNLSYETRVKAARHDQLRAAAQAVCDRWDSRDWGKLEHTGDYIRRLRLALDYDAARAAEPDLTADGPIWRAIEKWRQSMDTGRLSERAAAVDEAIRTTARAAEPATTINGEAPNAHNLLAALVDIYDDGQNNPPEHRSYVDGAWDDALNEARKFLAARAAEPEGWKLVPIKPTYAMVANAMKECGDIGAGSCGEHAGVDGDDMRSVWEAMLSTAPTSKGVA